MVFKIMGQVTIFVIVGILIVAIVGGIGYSVKVNRDSKINIEFFAQGEIKTGVENIQSSVINCIEEVSKDSLIVIGIQGGYYNAPIEYLDTGWGFIPYYYKEGVVLMPSRGIIINEIETYTNEFIRSCLDRISIENFELIIGKVDTNVLIKNEEVIFEVDGQIKIVRENKNIIIELENFPVSQPSALTDILEIAEYITDSHNIDPKMYCITCVDEMAQERDVYVQTTPLPDNSVYIIIGENKTADEPYLFGFLNKYTGEEISDDFKLTGEKYVPHIGGIEIYE